jgi:hypothetical protein
VTKSLDMLESRIRREWAEYARCRRCAVCEARTGDSDTFGRIVVVRGHHVITQQAIRAWARTHWQAESNEEAVIELLWDIRNCLPLCDIHHVRHHNAQRRVRRVELRKSSPQAFAFARQLELDWQLDRYYGAANG